MSGLLVVDVGSTFTKAALVTGVGGAAADVTARAETPTTSTHDVMTGVRTVAAALGTTFDVASAIGCSSAGGGLRLAIVGYERTVTAEAAYRVGLSAGAKVVHVAAGPLDPTLIASLVDDRPDIVLLVGGTDGGNAQVLLHNAAALARAGLPRRVPVVVAGNMEAQESAARILRAASVATIRADNVLPDIGIIAPESARAALRTAFLTHVIGGKGLSQDPAFTQVVRMATPDAVLDGVRVVAEVAGQDVLVVDIGGATTDIYSSVAVEQDAPRREVVADLRHARTVEADLGMRWSAGSVVEAAVRERLPMSPELPAYAASLAERPAYLPESPAEHALDVELARLAATIAVRRHARPPHPGAAARKLTDVGLVLGSGGVLRHHPAADADAVLRAIVTDRAGGWPIPRAPHLAVDTAYLLVVVGLLASEHPAAAARVARRLVRAARGR